MYARTQEPSAEWRIGRVHMDSLRGADCFSKPASKREYDGEQICHTLPANMSRDASCMRHAGKMSAQALLTPRLPNTGTESSQILASVVNVSTATHGRRKKCWKPSAVLRFASLRNTCCVWNSLWRPGASGDQPSLFHFFIALMETYRPGSKAQICGLCLLQLEE